MSTVELELLISNIQHNVNHIPNLNSGGCGFFALFVAEECKNRGIKYSIPIIDSLDSEKDWGEVKLNMLKIQEGVEEEEGYVGYYDKLDFSFSHAVIKIGRKYFDSEGVGKNNVDVIKVNKKSYPEYYYTDSPYTIEDMKVALELGGWNTAFNRERIGELKENINLAFDNILI